MATLADADRLAIWADVMRDLSRSHIEIPINNVDLRSLINFMDVQLESAETSIFTALPAGEGKAWLLAHPELGRELLARIERKRRETL
jgi:hypothetical protein